MVKMGIVIIIVAVVASMILANYMYTVYSTNYIKGVTGEKFQIGPVEYTLSYEGTNKGSKDHTPENIFVMIGIEAKNVGDERTLLTGGQFYILDETEKRHRAIYGEFSAKDLLIEWLEPGQSVERSTQFDIPFDKDVQYNIILRPQKEQSTVDTALICIINC